MGLLGARRPWMSSSTGIWWEDSAKKSVKPALNCICLQMYVTFTRRCFSKFERENYSKIHMNYGLKLSAKHEKLYCLRISTTASFITTRANLIPMQFLGPAPKGLNFSGSGHISGSRCIGHVGTRITISFGITRPFIFTDALATRSKREAMGNNRSDSLMTLSRYGHWTFGVFEKLGINGPKPVMYWGSVGRYNKVYYLDDTECAKKYGRVWGLYELRRPMLAVLDPEMLKAILVKECFTFFTNRRNFRLNGELYDAVNVAEDDQWRRIRSQVSPSFTSGRIKEMFKIMQHHSHKLVVSLRSKADNNEAITVKDMFGPYSMDVMASCVFSVDLDSINEPTNPFITHASKLFRFPVPLFLFQGFFPFVLPILELLGVSLFPKSSTTFFRAVVEKIRAERNESSRQNLADILQHFIKYQSEKLSENQGLNDHEIISQVTMLLFAGYETSATTLVFLAYSLARNPDVMNRLQQEIDSTFPNKGPVEYDSLMKMEYLSSVVDECLRLYPPAARLERMAKETVKIKGITILKNMIVMIPIYALHRDPELWPDPEEFRPDRFSMKNKQSINPYAYLPFGMGPRNCVGMRFALVMIKLGLVKVLQNYSFLVCEETEIPLKMHPEGLVGPLQPIKLKLQNRLIKSTELEK